ncbi:MAG: UPF0761 membrane protein [Porticoccaceae bacterium]|nr:MAG: UPF0761 membrane protein [Porticoccaceae bacterium]
MEHPALARASAAFQRARRFAAYLWERFERDGCRQSAAALTYVSLFAVVPLLTLVYSMLSLVPAFAVFEQQVNDLIFHHLLPESGVEVRRYLLEFTAKARRLSVVGVVMLIVTSYGLLATIEGTFNRIWGVARSRRGLGGFLVYWGILSFGPLLLGVGLFLHAYLSSLEAVLGDRDALGIAAFALRYLPWLLTWVAFTLLFVAVPNARVDRRAAAVGGLVAAVLFEAARILFGAIVAHGSFHNIYGAFAMVPLFLLWLHLGWMIVLGCAELTRALETFGTVQGYRLPMLVAAVLVCHLCWERQGRGRALGDRDVLAAGVQQEQWQRLRELLLRHRYLELTADNRYVLLRDLHRVTLWQLVGLLGENFTRRPAAATRERLAGAPWMGRLDRLLESAAARSREVLEVTLAELFEEPSGR